MQEYNTDQKASFTMNRCPNCRSMYNCTERGSVYTPLILQCAHICCESCIRKQISSDKFVTCKECSNKTFPRIEINENFHNLRENFPVAQHAITQIQEMEAQKFVDESKIGFSMTPSSVAIPEAIPELLSIKVCEECTQRVAAVKCQECKTMLCDDCFAEVHKRKTLKAHQKIRLKAGLPTSEMSDSPSGPNFLNAEYMEKLKELHDKCAKKRQRITNTLSTLSSEVFRKHTRNESKAEAAHFQELRARLAAHFSFAHNVLSLMQKTAVERLDSVASSMENSAVSCEQELKALLQSLDKNLQNLSTALMLPDKSKYDVPSMINEFEQLLSRPDAIMTKDVVPSQKKFELSDNWIRNMQEECDFDFGEGAVVRLVPSSDLNSLGLSAEQIQDVHSSVEILSSQSFSFSETSEGNKMIPGVENHYSRLSTNTLQRRRPLTTRSGGSLCDKTTENAEHAGHLVKYTSTSSPRSVNANLLRTNGSHYEPSNSLVAVVPGVVSGSLLNSNQCSSLASATSNNFGLNFNGDVNRNVPAISSVSSESPNSVVLRSHGFYQYEPLLLPGKKGVGEDGGFVETINRVYGKPYSRPKKPLMKTFPKQTFLPGASYYDVAVSYVENPSHFYVQSPHAPELLRRFSCLFSKAEDLPVLAVEDIEKDIMCIVRASDNSWYRARILEVSPDKIIEGQSNVLAFLVDFGRKELLPLFQCRKFTDTMINAQVEDELANLCCLYSCYPTNSPTWKQEIIDDFKKKIESNTLIMNVYKVSPYKYEVDLVYSVNNSYLSLSEYLLVTSRAQYCGPEEAVVLNESGKPLKFVIDDEFKIDEWVNVKVSHVNSPADFYIQRMDCPISSRRLKEALLRLGAYFRSKENYLKSTISNLVVGMPVAGQFTHDNKWYRAQVIACHGRNNFEVRYVDFGNTEKMSRARIRSLPEELIQFPIQGVHCALHDIVPFNKKYGKKETMFFVKQVVDKPLQMVIKEMKNDLLSVSLFENLDSEHPDCLNVKLIECGLVKGIRTHAEVQILRRETSPKRKQSSKKGNDVISKTDTGSVSSPADIGDRDSTIERNNSDIVEEEDDEAVVESKPKEEKLRVFVVSYLNPNAIYVQVADLRHIIVDLTSQMAKYYRDEKNHKDSLIDVPKEKLTCAIYHEKDRKWYRGVVQNVIDEDTVKVFLSDMGVEEVVPLKNVRKLPSAFKKVGDGAVCCSLAGIEVKDEWPKDIRDTMKAHLDKFTELYIIRKGRKENSLLVELWGKRIICEDPLEPSIEDWTNINELIKNNGVNEKIQSLCKSYKPPFEENLKKLEQQVGLKHPNDNVRDWLQSSITEASANAVEYDQLKDTEDPSPLSVSNVDDDDLECFASVSIEDNCEGDWLPAPEITETNFIGMPTYVDSNFNIYVQMSGGRNGVLDIISNGLQSRYQNTQPMVSDMHWRVGQICVAWYFLDHKWYRGRVLEVDKSKGQVHVEYVDYGNVEWIDPSCLRKQITLRDIPVQCYKFPVRSDCVSTSGDGKWPIPALDFIHLTIVEKICHIQLREEPGEDFYRIEKLYLPEKYDLFEILYQLNHAVCTSSTKENKSISYKSQSKTKPVAEPETLVTTLNDIQEENDESSSNTSIAPVENISDMIDEMVDLKTIKEKSSVSVNLSTIKQTTDSCELQVSELQLSHTAEVTVEVTEVFSWDVIAVNIIDSADHPWISETRKEFMEMNEELQVDAIKQPLVKSPYKGRVCCTKFEDGLWYRAIVIGKLKTGSNFVAVYYIDYGNISNVKISELHQLKKEWYHVKAQAVKCVIENIRVPIGSIDEKKVATKLHNCIFSKTFEAVIKPKSEKDAMYPIRLIPDDDNDVSSFFTNL